jgi:hypothetical protein
LMSIFDNARNRAKIARIQALNNEESSVQNYGDVTDSRVTVINYDPDKSMYIVRTLSGEIGYATNISRTQLGVGATVQATRKGNGFIVDYFDNNDNNKSRNNSNSTGNDVAKDAFNSNTTSLPILFSNFNNNSSNEGEDVWIAEPNGECKLVNVATGKAPVGSFKTKQECRQAQDSEYNCEGDGVCKPAPKGQGKYKTKSECEAALVLPGFTGGQCAGVKYVVTGEVVGKNTSGGTWGEGNTIQVGGSQTTGIGPIEWVQTYSQRHGNTNGPNGWFFAVRFANGIRQDVGVAIPYAWNGNPSRPEVTSITVSVAADSPVQEQPGGCGNPPKRCPL